MSRDWCIVVRPRESAGDDQIETTDLALQMREPTFDFDRSDGDFFVYVDAPHSVKRTEKAILHTLAASGLADAVVTPLPVVRWNDEQDSYVFDGATGEPEEGVAPGETRWAVKVEPASAFAWRELRADLERRGRRRLHETDHAIEVGARDEADARALAADLVELDFVRSAEPRPLSWFQRWWVREQELGNYEGFRDPTQPI